MSAMQDELFRLFGVHAAHAGSPEAYGTFVKQAASEEEDAIFSPQKTFESIKASVAGGLKDIFPIEGKKNRLVLEDVWIEEKDRGNPFRAQKEAKAKEKTYGIPIYGKVRLENLDGEVLDEVKRVKLSDLPKMTERNTFIVNGSEWNIPTQFRLKPGVYTVEQANGLPKTQINLGAGGRGRSMEIHLDPDKERLMFKVDTGTMPLYSILRGLGKSHEEIQKAWGTDLADKNKEMFEGHEGKDLKKFTERWLDQGDRDKQKNIASIREQFDQTQLDPDTTRYTLGKPYEKLDEDLLLDASAKLVKVQDGTESTDDRDHLMFKSVHGPDDIFRERFTANKRQLHFRMRRALDSKEKVRDVLSVPTIKKLTEGMFTSLSLSERSEQHNPIHIINEANKTTLMGEGALADLQMVKDDARSVHPSHLGILDPIKTPESQKIGVVNYMTTGAKKVGNELTGIYMDPKTKEKMRLPPGKAHFKKIALPDQFKIEQGAVTWLHDRVKIQHEGNVKIVPKEEVELVIPYPQALFSFATAKLPFLNSVSGGRAFMASKHPEQALSIVNREKALVLTDIGGGNTIEKMVGKKFSSTAPVAGTIKNITNDTITIEGEDKQKYHVAIYDNFKLNEKSFLHHTPQVRVGDKVQEGDLLADLNFTRDGELALGKNTRVAFIVDSGKTIEDGFVVSEGYAKQMAHEQMIEVTAPKGENFTYSKEAFSSHYPGSISSENASKLDDSGVIKKGSHVLPGEALFLALRKQEDTSEDRIFRALGRGLVAPMKNMAIFWEKDTPGEVIDVIETSKMYKVHIKVTKELKVADKLAGSYGNKGVVSEIRPDHLMPKDSEGNVIDLLFNPLGIVSRINPAQVMETALGRVAEKTGERQTIRNFKVENNFDYVMDKLEAAGVAPDDILTLHDGTQVSEVKEVPTEAARLMMLEEPVGGFEKGHRLKKEDVEALLRKKINTVKVRIGVGVGLQYFHKLAKTGDTGYSARAFGEGYDLNKQPLTGGDTGSKSMDQLTEWSMLAHGARNILREMSTFKGEQSDEYWRAIQMGMPVPPPKVPFSWKKFEGMLRTAGIDVEKNGSLLSLAPVDDKKTLALSSGEITDVKMLRGKGLKEHKGGLFDPELTGGTKGNKWTHMTLAEPIPNPIFKDPIKKLTGLNDTTYNGIVNGEVYVDKEGKVAEGGHAAHASDPDFLTGGPGIERMLSRVDLDAVYADNEKKAKRGKGSERNSANRALRYIGALKNWKRKPEEAYMTRVIPVLPPEMRPIYSLESGDLGVSPVNYLYRDLGLVSNQLKENKDLDDDLKADLRKAVYQGMEALVGTTQNKTLTRPVKGILSTISGDNPKSGFFQSKILRKQQDLAARGVAVPNPSLSIDEVGMPIKMGLQLFKPFIVQKLTRTHGLPMKEVVSRIKKAKRKHDPLVYDALSQSMRERPILLNRAPSLHKYSIQAFYAKPVQGKAIQTNNLIHKGFNLDHDGDALNIHIPVTPLAVRDAQKMLPSEIFRSPSVIGDSVVGNYTPMHMAQHGIWLLSKGGGKEMLERIYMQAKDVKEAIEKKELSIGDKIMFKEKATTAGHVLLNDAIPEEHRNYEAEFTGKFVEGLLERISKTDKQKAAQVASDLQKLGDNYSGTTSLSLFDVMPVKDPVRDAALKKMEEISKKDLDDKQKSIELLTIVKEEIFPAATAYGKKIKSNYMEWINSGATSKKDAVVQQISGPTIITDFRKNPIPVPVMKSYSEGLSVGDYFNAQYGARGGMIGRALSTAEPGYLNKLILNTSGDQLILGNDCGDQEGVEMSVTDPQVMDRFEVRTHKITTPDYLAQLKKEGKEKLRVRSPMTCKNANGICKMCYGPNEDGQLYEDGTNIGAIAGQGIGEPLTQAAMKSFHSGGAVWGPEAVTGKTLYGPQGFGRIKQLISMPNEPSARAVLSSKAGKVESVSKAAAGGYNVIIDGVRHRTTPGLPVTVKEGDVLQKGQALTEGSIDPREMLEKKGLRATQALLRDEMFDAYGRSNLKKKNFEVAVRGMTNMGTVVDNGGNPSFHVGDMVPVSQTVYDQKNPVQERRAEEAVGYRLAEDQHGLKKDHILEPGDLIWLAGKKVKVLVDRLKIKPVLYGVQAIPQKKGDWLAALGQERLQETLMRGTAMGASSDIHGTNPLSAYAYGAEFGLGEDGRY